MPRNVLKSGQTSLHHLRSGKLRTLEAPAPLQNLILATELVEQQRLLRLVYHRHGCALTVRSAMPVVNGHHPAYLSKLAVPTIKPPRLLSSHATERMKAGKGCTGILNNNIEPSRHALANI